MRSIKELIEKGVTGIKLIDYHDIQWKNDDMIARWVIWGLRIKDAQKALRNDLRYP